MPPDHQAAAVPAAGADQSTAARPACGQGSTPSRSVLDLELLLSFRVKKRGATPVTGLTRATACRHGPSGTSVRNLRLDFEATSTILLQERSSRAHVHDGTSIYLSIYLSILQEPQPTLFKDGVPCLSTPSAEKRVFSVVHEQRPVAVVSEAALLSVSPCIYHAQPTTTAYYRTTFPHLGVWRRSCLTPRQKKNGFVPSQ